MLPPIVPVSSSHETAIATRVVNTIKYCNKLFVFTCLGKFSCGEFILRSALLLRKALEKVAISLSVVLVLGLRQNRQPFLLCIIQQVFACVGRRNGYSVRKVNGKPNQIVSFHEVHFLLFEQCLRYVTQ